MRALPLGKLRVFGASIIEMIKEISANISKHGVVARTQGAMSSVKNAFQELDTSARQGLRPLLARHRLLWTIIIIERLFVVAGQT